MPKFRFLPEVASGSIAYEAFGKSERQLLENCGLALEEAMGDTRTIRRRLKEVINIRGTSFQAIAFSFLEKIVFLRQAKGMLFREFKLGFEQTGNSFLLQGFAYGENLDPVRHKTRSQIKTIDKSLFEVTEVRQNRGKQGKPTGFRSQVILGA